MVPAPGMDVFREANHLRTPAVIVLTDLSGADDEEVDVRVGIAVAARRRTE